MALAGGVVALFAYTRLVDKPVNNVAAETIAEQAPAARPVLTSYEIPDPQQFDFTYAAEQTVHAVVHVTTSAKINQAENPFFQFFYGDRSGSQREVHGYGSGVIISADGYIITNNHVIEDADNISVKLNDNREFKAEIVGRDPATDLALLKIKAENLSFLKYGDSDKLRLGEWVLAVGNPFNLTSSVTAGIVSAKGRSIQLNNTDYSIESYIQTDAALNPGNSGGALVDTKGQLVGITCAIISPSGAYAGNSFAIPVTIVKKVVDDLRQFGTVQRAIIGIEMRVVTEDDAKKQNIDEVKGVYISNVREGGAAEEANLKSGDIITKLDGIPVGSPSEFSEMVGRHRPGDKATLTYMRNGKESSVNITMKNIAGNTGLVTKGMGTGEVMGATFEQLSTSEKQMFQTDYGVKIVSVDDGWFKDHGFGKGTIVISVNGKKVRTSDEVRQATNNGSTLKSIEGFESNGGYFNYRIGR